MSQPAGCANQVNSVEKAERFRGNLYILAASMIWSTGGLLVKFVPWNGIVLNGIRSLLAFILFVAVRRSFRIKINRTVICAAIGLAVVTTLYVLANKMTTAANAIVLQYMSPIFVLIMQCIKEHRPPARRQIGIVAVTFAGMVLFFCDQLALGYMIGNLLAILAGVGFACVFFFNSQPEGSSDDANMLGFLISFIISIPFLFLYKPVFTTSSVIAAVLLGVFQVGVAYLVFGKGICRTDPVSSSLISMLEAVANPVWVFLFMGERPGKFALVGSVIILGAVAFNILTPAKHEEDAYAAAKNANE